MQLLSEIILIRTNREVTLGGLILYFSTIAGISCTLLNIGYNMQIKWLVVLATIDLIYYICTKLCVLVLLIARMLCSRLGIKQVFDIIMHEKFNVEDL